MALLDEAPCLSIESWIPDYAGIVATAAFAWQAWTGHARAPPVVHADALRVNQLIPNVRAISPATSAVSNRSTTVGTVKATSPSLPRTSLTPPGQLTSAMTGHPRTRRRAVQIDLICGNYRRPT